MDNKILKREPRFQGYAFDVSKMTVRMPNGRKKDYDLVEHGNSVTIVPVSDDGQLYFVTQYRIGSDSKLLELPAGVLDPNETPLDAAYRELQEEIGKAPGDLQELGGFFLAPGYANEYMLVYLGQNLSDSVLDPDDDEFLDIVKMPIADVYQKAVDGEIHDGKTLAALLLAQPYLIMKD
jgi:ADP-ribose pyrophosphatase